MLCCCWCSWDGSWTKLKPDSHSIQDHVITQTSSHWSTISSCLPEPRISGLVHPECPLGPLPALWGHGTHRPQPAVSHHWGTLPRWRITVPAGLPHPLQTPAGECPTGSMCEYQYISVHTSALPLRVCCMCTHVLQQFSLETLTVCQDLLHFVIQLELAEKALFFEGVLKEPEQQWD